MFVRVAELWAESETQMQGRMSNRRALLWIVATLTLIFWILLQFRYG
jgi:hypothetical protein